MTSSMTLAFGFHIHICPILLHSFKYDLEKYSHLYKTGERKILNLYVKCLKNSSARVEDSRKGEGSKSSRSRNHDFLSSHSTLYFQAIGAFDLLKHWLWGWDVLLQRSHFLRLFIPRLSTVPRIIKNIDEKKSEVPSEKLLAHVDLNISDYHFHE